VQRGASVPRVEAAAGAEAVKPPVLLLAARRCDQCLTTRTRIVEGARAAQIVRDCRREDRHFVCHKGSAAGLIVHCRGVHELLRGGGRAHRFAKAAGIEVREVDPMKLEEDQ
jgi:hypothetical protein